MTITIPLKITLLLLAARVVDVLSDEGPRCDVHDDPRHEMADCRHEMVLLQSKPVRRSRAPAEAGAGAAEEEEDEEEEEQAAGTRQQSERKSTSERNFVQMGKQKSVDEEGDAVHRPAGKPEVCGTRPLFPQLQFELEVYRKLGLVTSQYAQCSVPNIRDIALDVPLGSTVTSTVDSLYENLDFLMASTWEDLRERRTLIAHGLVGIFCALALMTIGSYATSMYSAMTSAKTQDDMGLIQTSWKQSAMYWMGTNLVFLEPLIARFGWPDVSQISLQDSDASPEAHIDAYVEFRKAWQEEVNANGLENADLLRTAARFVGTRVLVWMLFTAGVAALLELAAMTVVLDMLLNYLHLARAARMQDETVSLDVLRPTVMFICAGFCIPMAARVFSNMASLCDAFHTNRITAGMLAVVYEKNQQLPYSKTDDKETDVVQAVQILTNDIRRMWAGAFSSCAQLIVLPVCVLVLLIFLMVQLGNSASFGLLCTIWMGLLYFPIRNHVSRGNQRWGQLASTRVDLMKEACSNIRTVKATLWNIPLSERIYALQEEELQTRFRFSMVQSLLDVPFNLFPFALMVLSLFFCFVSNGKVRARDVFVCMQALSGLTYCLPGIARSLQKYVNVLNASRRVQRFLQEPEKPLSLLNRPGADAGFQNAPHVRLRGNFAAGEGQRPVLSDLNFQVQRGELVAVVGEVASGKSALLSAIMGDLPGCDGGSSVEAPKNAIYCAQEPWVVDGTLKENITMGDKDSNDQERLYSALDSASLLKDVIISGEPQKQKSMEASTSSAARAVQDYDRVGEEERAGFIFPYFGVWNVFAVVVFTLSAANVKWRTTRPALGMLIAAIQGLLHWSVLEFPIQTIATLMTTVRRLRQADGSKLTICMNYNLLATSQADVDECMHNMLEAYMLNLGENVSSCLVSATNDPNLQQYELQVRNDHRAKVYKELFRAGLAWAGFGEGGDVNIREHLWKKYAHIEKNTFVQQHLSAICERFAKEYMVLHRTSRVLRKCGQYQDLILLSAGEDMAFTYCDTELYGRAARKYGEPLFKQSEDTDNMRGRQFDYTLVLDSDTRVTEGFIFDVLEIAAAYPEKAIVQPAIKMDIGPSDSIFMHLEAMRQRVYEPMNSTITTLLGKSSFFGKGLIRNAAYAKYCLGTREHLIEAVPINVLSHDTFEAAVASPLYVHSLYLLEAPCHNYITWDIRERRWNLGEMLLAGYFWPNGVGKPIERLQKIFQGEKYNSIQVRTMTKMDRVTSYFAFSALRQMVLKPMLLAYIVVMHFVTMRAKWAPLIIVMFCIIVMPKFAIMSRHNWKAVMLETGASFLQFTPEAIVGTIRVLSAVKAHLAGAATWVPQRSVEEESKVSNPFVFSMRYLWYYSVFAMVWGLRVGFLAAVGPEAMFVITILGTLFMLPLYVGITSLPANSLRHLTGGGKDIVSHIKDEEHQAGGVADPADAALQAFRVRLASARLRTGNGKRQRAGLPGLPERHENALHVFHATSLKVGLHGISLSNSERVRLALARAAYSRRSNLVLIDDPFGHVDAPTGREIFHKLIRGPLMMGRTRIVVMQPYTDYLEYFDQVIMLSEGRIVLKGKPLDVLATREFQELMAKMARETSIEDLAVAKPQLTSEEGSPLKLGCACEGVETLQGETQELPQWDKVWDAVLTGGLWRLCIAMLAGALIRITVQGQMILLGRWADQAQARGEVGSNYYMMTTLIVVLLSVCQVLQSYFMQAFSSNVSREVFRRAFQALLKAPVEEFWHRHPTGRIIGRLTSDILNVDSTLATGFVSLAGIAIDIVVQQVYCSVVMPIWLMFPTYVVMGFFCRFFCNTTLRLQLVSALGLTRCQEEQVQLKIARRSVQAFQYENKLVSRYCAHAGWVVMPESLSSHMKTWTVSRITFCLCFQCTLCVLVGILRPEMIGVGTLAIIITFTFLIVQQLQRCVDALVDMISLCISLQRLSEYSKTPQDPPDQLVGDEQRRNQLVTNGIEVRIEGLRFGYGTAGPEVLTNINFEVGPRSKAVLAGGPGCGKSTVLYCILRILNQRAGRVTLSGMDTRNLGILTLRSVIGLVAQEPVIFQGSVRFNIDPFNQYSDERIWVAIQCAQLLPAARRFTGLLDHVFSEEGLNLSHGQKQLFNLARAVCQQPPLLLLDECCSSLDPRTQDAVQETIMLNFPNSTIIAATRRMDEIKNFQHMVLLEKGQVVRQGPVSRLLPGGAGAAPAPVSATGSDGP